MECGIYTDVDGATAKRLKRGEYPVDQRLDLHGMDRFEAQDTLRGAVKQAYHAGSRCLLVITGKGKGGEGVLRGMLPVWLNEPDIRPLLLAFGTAAVKHGGDGAFYVLVKRKRGSGKGMEERSDD